MWIRIKQAEGPNLAFPVPLMLLQSRLLWRLIERNTSMDERYSPMAREAVAELSRYVRRHGHFILVEVQSADGEHIKIVV